MKRKQVSVYLVVDWCGVDSVWSTRAKARKECVRLAEDSHCQPYVDRLVLDQPGRGDD